MPATRSFPNQIDNRNFLSPVGFKFSLAKEPKAAFFCNSARIPEITLSTITQSTYLKDIDVPGDKLTYGDLSLRFLVDENMENYMAIHNWLTGIGFPETTQDFRDLVDIEDDVTQKDNVLQVFSDGSLYILNSNYKTTAIVKFKDLFPTSLTSLEFNATANDVQYFTAEASFKYTVYNILGPTGTSL
jgi:hypothetical protein